MLTRVARVTRVALCTPIACVWRTLWHGWCYRWIVMPVGSRCSQMWCEMCCWTWFKAVGGARAVHWLPVDQCGWHCDKRESRRKTKPKTETEREREWRGNRTERCSLFRSDIYVYTNIVSFLICVTRCVFSFLFFCCCCFIVVFCWLTAQRQRAQWYRVECVISEKVGRLFEAIVMIKSSC